MTIVNRLTGGTRRAVLTALVISGLIAGSATLGSYGAADGAAEERTGVTDSEILIGSGLPFTGKLGWRGPTISHAVNAYFDEINDKGGVNGRKLKLVTCDDGYDPEKAVGCFNTALKGKVFMGAFFTGSPTNAKYVRMAEVNKMPLFGFMVGTPIIYDFNRYRFVLRPSYMEEAERHITYLWNTQKARKFAVLYQADALGAAVREPTVKTLKKFNAIPVWEASYTREQNDVTAALKAVMAAKPEVVMLGVSSAEVKECVDFRNAQNWKALFVILSAQDDAVINCGKAANGIIVSQVLPGLDENLPTVKEYLKILKKHFPSDEPKVAGFEAYVNAMVIVDALKHAGRDLTRSKFIEAVESLHDLDIGLGTAYAVHFSPKNHVGWGDSSIYLSEVVNGKLSKATDARLAAAIKEAMNTSK